MAVNMKDFKSRRIAVVGVSHRQEKFGFRIFRDLLQAGFSVEGVNPAGGEAAGRQLFRSLGAIGGGVDLVITVVAPQVTEKVVEECKEAGVAEIWMQPGSESETAKEKARAYGIAVTSNACFMKHAGLW